MDSADFRKEFLEGVKAAAVATGEGSCACFVENMASYLVDAEVIADVTPCYFIGDYKRKKYRIDGYAFDEFDKTMTLVVADYDGIDTDRKLIMSVAKQSISRAMIFVNAAINSDLCDEVDISMSASDLIDLLRASYKQIRKYEVYLFTDGVTSERIKTIDVDSFDGVPVEAQIWDINRLYDVCTSPEIENIEVKFDEFGSDGIPCIEANVGDNQKYKSYLGVIPGDLLATIYDKYGARLLEGNVRSFLSTKVAVNKKIRATILKEPEMFFAFNNGISVTAKDVVIEEFNGLKRIVQARDFQIINGGQTTASLYNAKRNDHADLSNIYVQMKLTEIDEEKVTVEAADQLIRDISRSSNSQNKVSDADFFASHPFHRQMEQLSKITYAPAVHGVQYQTVWFYERARGQYLQEQMRLTPAKKNAFLLKNPKNQVIKKTDLAKVQNSWLGHPDVVSKGAQTNFVQFANYIDAEWQSDSSQFNERYFQNTVALMIIFDYLNGMVSKQPWYEGGYRANVLTYTVAMLNRLITHQYPGFELDFQKVWQKQSVPEQLEGVLIDLSGLVFEKITDPKRGVMNVTQWCKRKECWESVQKISMKLPEELMECLVSTADSKHSQKMAKKEQKMVDDINAQQKVIEHDAAFWHDLTLFAVNHQLVSQSDVDALRIACQIPTKIPNTVQAKRLLAILDKASMEGFIV